MSNEDQTVVDDTAEQTNMKFGELSVTKGNEHKYLGMKIRYNDNHMVDIGIEEYALEVIDTFSEKLKVISAVARSMIKKLFEADETFPRLDEHRSSVSYHCVAKLIYVSMRCRLGTILTISFLYKRVSCSTEEAWLKLKRLIRYLHGTKKQKLTLGVKHMSVMQVMIDVAYAVHTNMRSHTGVVCFFLKL